MDEILKNTERPNIEDWTHSTRSSKGRCLHPFDESEMRKCPKYVASGDVYKCLNINRKDYTSCLAGVKS